MTSLIFRSLFAFVLCSSLVAQDAAAQAGLSERLVTTWRYTIGGKLNVFLEIRTVEPGEAGTYKVTSLAGLTPDKMFPMNGVAAEKDGRLTLQFKTVMGNNLTLAELPNSSFAGSWTDQKGSTYPVTMSKVSFEAALGRVDAGSVISVIYISAPDCTPCRLWSANKKQPFLDSATGKNVQFFNAQKDSYRDRTVKWPEDLKWVEGQVKDYFGVPSYAIAVDKTVVRVGYGSASWEKTVLPQLDELVKKKAAAPK